MARDLIFTIRVDDKGTASIQSFAGKSTTALKRLQGSAKKTGSSFNAMKASAKGSFSTFATGLIPTMGIMAAFNKLRQVMKETIQVGRDFEKAFANVVTLFDKGTVDIDNFRQSLIDIPPVLGKVIELTNAAYQAVSAGVKPAGVVAFIGVAAKTAAAGLADLEVTTKTIASTMNSYGMSSATSAEAVKSATDIANILFKTVKGGITTISELAAGMGMIAATAAGMNVPLEQVGAAVAALTKKGLRTRLAMMGLNRTLMGFLTPQAKTREAVRDLGIEFDITQLAIGGIPYMIKIMTDQMTDALPIIEKMTEAGASEADIFETVARVTGKNIGALARLFPNVSSMRTMLMLASDGGVSFNEQMDQMAIRAGAMGDAFAIQGKTMNKFLETVSNTTERMKIQLWHGLTKPLLDAGMASDSFKDKFAAFAKNAIEKSVKVGEAMAKFLTALFRIRKSIGNIVVVYTAWYILIKKTLATKVWGILTAGYHRVTASIITAKAAQGGFLTQLKAMRASRAMGGFAGLTKTVVGKAGFVAAAALAGWEVGKFIGKLKFFGQDRTVNEWIQGWWIGSKRLKTATEELIKSEENLLAVSTKMQKAHSDVYAYVLSETGRVAKTNLDVVGALGKKFLETGTTGFAAADKWIVHWIKTQKSIKGVVIAATLASGEFERYAKQHPDAIKKLYETIKKLAPAMFEFQKKTGAAGIKITNLGVEVEKWAKGAGFDTMYALIRDAEQVADAIEYATGKGMTWAQAVEVMGGGIVALGDKIVPLAKMYGEKLPEKFLKAYYASLKSTEGLELLREEVKKTTSAVVSAATKIDEMTDTYGDWNEKLFRGFDESFEDMARGTADVIYEIDKTIADVYDKGTAREAMDRALEADTRRWDMVRRQISDEIRSYTDMYKDKKEAIDEYYEEELRKFNLSTDIRFKELDVVIEVERLKREAVKARTAGELAVIKEGAEKYKQQVLSEGAAEIAGHKKAAVSALDVYKEKYIDPRVAALTAMYALIDKAEKDSTKRISKGLEAFQTKLENISSYMGQATQAWDAMWAKITANQMQRIDNEYEARKQMIDASMMSDEEKFFAVEKLDREMEKRRISAMRKQAIAEKASAFLGAIVNTALAVVKALAVGGIPGIILAGIVGAMGAVQVALIASQPLPSFATGGIAWEPQVAMVAERGPEVIRPLAEDRKLMAATGKKVDVNLTANFYIKSPDTLGWQRIVREKIAPEFVNWVRLNKSEMAEAIGE